MSILGCLRGLCLSSRRVDVLREEHLEYVSRGLKPLPAAFVGLDANLPWICYWNLHSIDLLSGGIPADAAKRALGALRACQHPEGGFGGGLGQEAHLACTFAAVSALAAIGTAEAYDLIDIGGLRRFLCAMRQPNGSFSMQRGGEADCRGSYCALAAASLCGLLEDIAGDRSAAYIASCQTHEGGLGGVPWAEAHAGYTYCGFAALSILAKASLVDLDGLAAFARRSQCTLSGGFRGRTNKLVDGCYSFWSGALFPLIRRALPSLPPFDTAGLQTFLLVCCQDPQGGLRDKPGRYAIRLIHTTVDDLGAWTITIRATACRD